MLAKLKSALKANGVTLTDKEINGHLDALGVDSSSLVPAELSNIVTQILSRVSAGALATPTASSAPATTNASRENQPKKVEFNVSVSSGVMHELKDQIDVAEEIADEVSDAVSFEIVDIMTSIPGRSLEKVEQRLADFKGHPDNFRSVAKSRLIEALIPSRTR